MDMLRSSSELDHLEVGFLRRAVRATERFGHVRPARSRGDAVLRKAGSLVVRESAQDALPGLELAVGIRRDRLRFVRDAAAGDREVQDDSFQSLRAGDKLERAFVPAYPDDRQVFFDLAFVHDSAL